MGDEMTISSRSALDDRALRGTANPAGGGGPASPAPANFQQRAIVLTIAAALVTRLFRDRRFQVRMITLAIGAAALSGLARESQTRSLSRLAAWYRRHT
jgi:hypothetical protein